MTDDPLAADELPPLVLRAEPVAPVRPQPGFWLGAGLTILYWICLIGGMIGIVVIGAVAIAVFGEKNGLDVPPDAGSDMAKMPVGLRTTLAWSFPGGYFFGLLFSVIVIRVVIGRGWFREIGLARLPAYHLLVALLALPGFMILSDALARFVQPIDNVVHESLGIDSLGDTGAALAAIFAHLHWSVAVLAIGIGPGVVEELWCRGFLGRGFIPRYGWFAGIGLSSVFFGMLHLWPPSYVITTAAMGACLHFAYITSRSLWVPIAMHLVNNSFAGLVSVGVVNTTKMEAAAAGNEVLITMWAAVVLVACGAAVWQARWRWPGETPGRLIPPKGSAVELQSETPRLLFFAPAIVSCAGMVWFLVR